ncbi:MAG: sugar phosphate isomerase/epimerase [Acidobacteria bacterium]|nr:sugar phosphate isomerase/epimerase [Acidobacteriota bacterium]
MDRREFLKSSAFAVCGGAFLGGDAPARAAQTAGVLKKAVCIGVLPRNMPLVERFELARKAGFEGVEPNTLYTTEEVKEYKEAAQRTGIRIHSIMNSDHWKYPLTDNDPEVVKKCIEGIKTSMQNAHELGADTVLLVPGIVTAEVRYIDVYRRSQEQIRRLIPLAKQLKVVIAIENVGNRFLLSPLEFIRYIDEFKSPYVKAYFDIGNIVASGYPQDWIRTIGKRLVKVHIKRFEPGSDQPKFDPSDRRTQGINWPDVRKALGEVGYSGWITAEVKTGDEAYLRELSARMDKFLGGVNPA